MFAIEIQSVFSASHQLRLPGNLLEALHGHNWHVTVRVEAPTLDALETVMDFHRLQDALAAILKQWNNRHLNQIAPFDETLNPTAERIAEHLAGLLTPLIAHAAPHARLASVRLTEAPGCTAIWQA